MIEDLGQGRAFATVEIDPQTTIAVRGPKTVVMDTLGYFEKRYESSRPPAPIPGQTNILDELGLTA